MATSSSKKQLAPARNLALVPCRLPVASAVLNEIGLDPSTWAVLTDSIFPSASTPEGVMLTGRYCQARSLDIMKRPVHVVPMWSKAAGRYVETVWPGIAEVQTTAARTGLWAGLDSPKFGPEVTKTFAGSVKRDGRWEDDQVTVTFPEWAEVTVYRLVNGVRCAFSETVFWEETYARQGKADLPNDMWQKRPRGQLLKCAKAASLRAAFPEEAGYTAEEMEGKALEGHAPIGSAVIAAEVATVHATTPVEARTQEPPKETPVDASPRESETTVQGEPTPAAAAAAAEERQAMIDEQVKTQVARLIARAAKVRAWGQAEDYLRSRFNGEHLKYALGQLEKAVETAVAQAKAA
jgi:phage recombination protein Bet